MTPPTQLRVKVMMWCWEGGSFSCAIDTLGYCLMVGIQCSLPPVIPPKESGSWRTGSVVMKLLILCSHQRKDQDGRLHL